MMHLKGKVGFGNQREPGEELREDNEVGTHRNSQSHSRSGPRISPSLK